MSVERVIGDAEKEVRAAERGFQLETFFEDLDGRLEAFLLIAH